MSAFATRIKKSAGQIAYRCTSTRRHYFYGKRISILDRHALKFPTRHVTRIASARSGSSGNFVATATRPQNVSQLATLPLCLSSRYGLNASSSPKTMTSQPRLTHKRIEKELPRKSDWNELAVKREWIERPHPPPSAPKWRDGGARQSILETVTR